MRIDLHCHTKATKQGDGPGRNVTPELFKSKIIDADVKIVAITNHNAFDYNQYIILADNVDGICHVWPGIEIDIQEPQSKRWHLIVIVNPTQINDFNSIVNSMFKDKNINDCAIGLDEVCHSFCELDAIYIAHFYQKKPAAPEEDYEKLMRLVGQDYRVFRETSNENSMSIFANYRFNVLVGSDVKEWDSYEKCSFSELKLPVDSFEQFCLLSKRDSNVVETLINQKEFRDLVANPAPSVSLQIRIYQDINIIFGQKGTGKTNIVHSLYEHMKTCGYKCTEYCASGREEDFNKLIGLKGAAIDLGKMGMQECEEDFNVIYKWSDSLPTNFVNYINWKNTEGNNANKTRMRITRSLLSPHTERKNYTIHKNDQKAISVVNQNIDKMNLNEYLDDNEIDDFTLLLHKLSNSVYEKRLEDIIDDKAQNMVTFTINKIKAIADKCTNSVSRPSSTGFINYLEVRLALLKAIRNILINLNCNEYNDKEKIGALEDKGDLFVNTKYRMLCDSSKTDEFTVGIKKLKKVKMLLNNIKEHILDEDLGSQIQELGDLLEEMKIRTIKPFVGRSKQIINQKGEIYNPSNGEKGMLLIQRSLKHDADAYFIDEPELGMGHSYINTTIRPMLIDLAQRFKYVVIATHDANIAVRTLPYVSIYRTHSNGKYSTYIGNPFTNMLVNMDNDKDVLNWADESLKSLEGGREAFYERKDIYESNRS